MEFDLSRFLSTVFLLLILSTSSYSQVIYRGLDPKQVALTFDDGPSSKYTQKVLDILKRENVKATFFVIGKNAAFHADLLKKIAAGGNEIGNHTYYHSRLGFINKEKLIQEINLTSYVVSEYTGKKPAYFRPPFGALNKKDQKLIEDAGYKIVMWYGNADDFYHLKWGMRSSKSITTRVLSQLKGGNIILMHDDSKQIVEALPGLIQQIKKRGYHFVTLSELKVASN